MTAYSSAMPTSYTREGKAFAMMFRPHPSGIAPVMPTMRLSLVASSVRASPNTLVRLGVAAGAALSLPDSMSNGLEACHLMESASDLSHP